MALLNKMECESCHFKYDTFELDLQRSICPQCFARKLKLVDQEVMEYEEWKMKFFAS